MKEKITGVFGKVQKTVCEKVPNKKVRLGLGIGMVAVGALATVGGVILKKKAK